MIFADGFVKRLLGEGAKNEEQKSRGSKDFYVSEYWNEPKSRTCQEDVCVEIRRYFSRCQYAGRQSTKYR